MMVLYQHVFWWWPDLVPLDIRNSVRRQHNVHDVVDQPVFQNSVTHLLKRICHRNRNSAESWLWFLSPWLSWDWGRRWLQSTKASDCCQWWCRTRSTEQWTFQSENIGNIKVDNIHLVTMSIWNHDWSDRLQAVDNQPVDLVEQLVARLPCKTVNYRARQSIIMINSNKGSLRHFSSSTESICLFTQPFKSEFDSVSPCMTPTTHTRYNCTHANLSRNKHSTKLASLLPVYCQKFDLLPVCHETSRGRAWGSRCWASPRGCCCTPPSQGYIRRRRRRSTIA